MATLKRLDKALRVFISETGHSRAELPQLLMFCGIALAGDTGLTVTEASEAAGLSSAGGSRNLKILGPQGRGKFEGLALIDISYDPMRPLFKILKLSKKGQALVQKIEKALE